MYAASDFVRTLIEMNESVTKGIDVNPRVKYYDHLAVRKDEEPLTITFDDIDELSTDDFQKGFNEVILNEDYVHLYFDFDQITIIDELENVFEWLADLTNVFGEYSYSGYTDDEEVANSYGLRLYPEGNHFASIHVIYYQTRISTDDLLKIVEKDIKKNHPLMARIDDSVVFQYLHSQMIIQIIMARMYSLKKRRMQMVTNFFEMLSFNE